MTIKRAIILAAGKSLQLDGESKVLIRHPKTRRTVLEHAIDAFYGMEITVVVGYRAIQIMHAYPDLKYVHNQEWALTNNALSLALALTDEPTYVVSGDIFLDRALIDRLNQEGSNLVLSSDREKRALSAIHCVCTEGGQISETYQGPIKDVRHPEAVGLFKVSSTAVLREWKRSCNRHANLFAGQLIPCDLDPVKTAVLGDELFFEINTPGDYLELIEKSRDE
jgi:choline kinase